MRGGGARPGVARLLRDDGVLRRLRPGRGGRTHPWVPRPRLERRGPRRASRRPPRSLARRHRRGGRRADRGAPRARSDTGVPATPEPLGRRDGRPRRRTPARTRHVESSPMTTTELTGAEDVAWDLSDLYESGDDPRLETDVEEAEQAA